MAKTKISEFSSTPANNTDIDSINIAEGCAPSGINDAIRELMAQLKDFQTGAQGDSFNGPIGTSTAAAGAFTTLSATGAITSTLATGTAPLVIASTTKVANLNVDLLDGADWASPAALGSTTPAAVSATTLSASSTVTLSGGTANGVAYLNGSKVVTSGSALTFDGTNLALTTTGAIYKVPTAGGSLFDAGGNNGIYILGSSNYVATYVAGSEQMRLTSTGLGIGTSSILSKLVVSNGSGKNLEVQPGATTYFFAYDRTASDYLNLDIAGEILTFSTNNGTERMRIDSSGNVGIGTSSPAVKLHVSGQSRVADSSNAANYMTFGVGANAPYGNASISTTTAGLAIVAEGAGNMTFFNNGSERMRIDSSGNLGLGVTPSAWNTDYRTYQLAGGGALFNNGGNNFLALSQNLFVNASSENRYIATAAATRYRQSAGTHIWDIAPSGTAGNAISFTQAMTLDASGRLGIGTTSPGAQLTVIGSAAKLYVDLSGDNYYDAANHVFRSFAGTERARIDSSGNLLIGKTSADDTIGGFSYFGASKYLSLVRDNSAPLFINRLSTDGAVVEFARSTTLVGTISVTTTATAYNTSSDYRLKNAIAPMTGALAKVALLKPCTYKWNADGSDGEGFIAHELAEVVPQCVTGEKDAVDENGNPKYQGIDTSFLVATLTAALQEAVAEINQLKARLDAANL